MIRKRIISFVLVIVTTFSFMVLPTSAADQYQSTAVGFWDWLGHFAANNASGQFSPLITAVGGVMSRLTGSDSFCSSSDDNYHHGRPVDIRYKRASGEGDTKRFLATCQCDYCGKEFTASVYDDDLKDAYNSYVDELPVNGIDSEGGLVWYPTWADLVDSTVSVGIGGGYIAFPASDRSGSFNSYGVSRFAQCVDERTLLVTASGPSSWISGQSLGFSTSLVIPISGVYTWLVSPYIDYNSDVDSGSFLYPSNSSSRSAGNLMGFPVSRSLPNLGMTSVTAYYYLPVLRITPSDNLTQDQWNLYNVNTRTGTISGGLGIIGDNGTINKTDNTYIFNELTGEFSNPATGGMELVTEWNYDYSDRSYHLTLESGDTVTVTYGDEYITIEQNQEIYNIYYIIDGDDADDPGTGGGSGGNTDPGGPSDPGSGDSDDGFLGKLGELLGKIFGGMLDLLLSLGRAILDKLEALVDLIFGLFEKIPALFAGYLAFLTAIFPFLPEEVFLILTFGILLLVLIGIIKAVRR